MYVPVSHLILMTAEHFGIYTWRVLHVSISDPLKQGKNEIEDSFRAELEADNSSHHTGQRRASEKMVTGNSNTS